MRALEQFLALLFGAVVVMLVITNPRGIESILTGLTEFTRGTVGAFAGRGGLG